MEAGFTTATSYSAAAPVRARKCRVRLACWPAAGRASTAAAATALALLLVSYTAAAAATSSCYDAISVGGFHGLVLSRNTSLAFGEGGAGQTDVPAALAGRTLAVAAGGFFSCALHTVSSASSATIVSCWGASSAVTTVPSAVASDGGVRGLAAGGYHACAVLSNRSAVCWGANGAGQTSPLPASVVLSGVTSLALGAYHSCAVLASGAVACWGRDDAGQVSGLPASLASGSGGTSLRLACGGYHCCAWGPATPLVCWGAATAGQTAVPTSVASASVSAACGGGYFSCAVVGGSVSCWGASSKGETTVPAGARDGSVAAVACGWYGACALSVSGGLTCWGGSLGRVSSASLPSSNVALASSDLIATAASNSSGTVFVSTGAATTLPAGTSGAVSITTGNASAASGAIVLATGSSAAGSRGAISLLAPSTAVEARLAVGGNFTVSGSVLLGSTRLSEADLVSLLALLRVPSPSPSASSSVTVSVTPSLSASATRSVTSSSSTTPTLSTTPSTSPSPSATRSATPSTSLTGSVSTTPSGTPSGTVTGSQTPSTSRSPSFTPSQSVSPSATRSTTPSLSRSISLSASTSRTPSRTPSPTIAPSDQPLPSNQVLALRFGGYAGSAGASGSQLMVPLYLDMIAPGGTQNPPTPADADCIRGDCFTVPQPLVDSVYGIPCTGVGDPDNYETGYMTLSQRGRYVTVPCFTQDVGETWAVNSPAEARFWIVNAVGRFTLPSGADYADFLTLWYNAGTPKHYRTVMMLETDQLADTYYLAAGGNASAGATYYFEKGQAGAALIEPGLALSVRALASYSLDGASTWLYASVNSGGTTRGIYQLDALGQTYTALPGIPTASAASSFNPYQFALESPHSLWTTDARAPATASIYRYVCSGSGCLTDGGVGSNAGWALQRSVLLTTQVVTGLAGLCQGGAFFLFACSARYVYIYNTVTQVAEQLVDTQMAFPGQSVFYRSLALAPLYETTPQIPAAYDTSRYSCPSMSPTPTTTPSTTASATR